MNKESVEAFEKLYIQMKVIHSELSLLSKKSPDGAINKFKLNLVNQLLTTANQILTEQYKPFDGFSIFQEDGVPTNSDVVLVVSQYIRSLDRFKVDFTKKIAGAWCWLLENGEKIETTHPALDLIK